MARDIHTTLELTGELVALSPIHIGSATAGVVVDMPVAVNGAGRNYLPGTSLTGALRNWAEQHLEGLPWKVLWGSHEKEGGASLILVDDAPQLDPEKSAPPELWHSVSIDRETGAAADKLKFDREVMPRGSRFGFRLQIEARTEAERGTARQLLGRLAQALGQGSIRFGGATTRGMGSMQLDKPVGRETHWSTKVGVLDFLKGERNDALPSWQRASESLAVSPHGRIDITIHWQPRGPLMSKAATDGLAVDGLPFVTAVEGGKQALALPGSGIKGALRSHAERILRTIFEKNVAGNADNHTHLDQLDLPLIREVFGSARTAANNKNQGNSRVSPGGRGALAVATCYATSQRKSADTWNTLAIDNNAWQNTEMSLQRAYHVAVDRWTGGAADGFLYSAVEPMGVEWEPMRLSLDLNSGTKEGHDGLPRFALVWLLLKELAAGRITLGFGANRGYGEVEVRSVELRGLPAGSAPINLDAQLATDDANYQTWLLECNGAWKDWIEHIEEELDSEATRNEQ